MEGCNDKSWDFEHMAGQNEPKTQLKPQPQRPGAPRRRGRRHRFGFCTVFSHRFGRPCAQVPYGA
eukprot:4325297-Heterocapsa_arctica.AAC.1